MKSIWYGGSGAAGVGMANNYALANAIAPNLVGSGTVLYSTPSYFTKSFNGGTFSGLWIYIPSNTRVTDTLIRFINNGVVGNQILTIPAGATGFFQDTTNSDVVTAGNHYAIGVTFPVGGNTISYSQIGGMMEDATSPYLSKFMCLGSATLNGVTRYGGLAGTALAQTLDTIQATTMTSAGTLKRLTARVYVNSCTADITVKSRINGADGNLTLTIPAATTGFFEDTTNSDTIAANDLVNLVGTAGASTGSANFGICSDFESSGSTIITGNVVSALSGITPGTGKFYRLNCSGSTNVLQVQAQMYCPGTFRIKNARVRLWTNGHNADSTWTLQKNGVDTSVVLTIPALTTGEFIDSVDTVDVVAGDLLNWKLDMPGAGNATVYGMSFDVEDPTPPPPSGGGGGNLLLMGVG
jgi:hypothetical protein